MDGEQQLGCIRQLQVVHRVTDQRADDAEAVDLLGQRQAGDAPGEVASRTPSSRRCG